MRGGGWEGAGSRQRKFLNNRGKIAETARSQKCGRVKVKINFLHFFAVAKEKQVGDKKNLKFANKLTLLTMYSR